MYSELFQQFVRERIYLKGVTKKTVKFYGNSWASFEKHHSGELSKQSLKTYVTAMRQSGIKPVSCNTYISCINAFLRWMNEEGHHPEVLKISKLKVEKKVFRTFSEPQLRLIVSHKPKGFHETRIHVLLLLLIDTGIRIDEALTAQSSRVDFDNLLITVRGKGNKERIIPFSIELRKHLFKFLRHGKRYVFPVRSGNHLEYHNARRSFKALMVKLGINGVDGAFHASRRCFARTYLRKGGNLHYLKNVLGHEDIKTTEGYLDDDTRALQAIHQNVSPLSTLRV